MALSERENLILLQLEQSLRADGRTSTRRQIVVAVATAAGTLAAVALIAWAALAPPSAWTVAATGIAGVLIGALAFSHRVAVQTTAIRLHAATKQRLRKRRQPPRRRRRP